MNPLWFIIGGSYWVKNNSSRKRLGNPSAAGGPIVVSGKAMVVISCGLLVFCGIAICTAFRDGFYIPIVLLAPMVMGAILVLWCEWNDWRHRKGRSHE